MQNPYSIEIHGPCKIQASLAIDSIHDDYWSSNDSGSIQMWLDDLQVKSVTFSLADELIFDWYRNGPLSPVFTVATHCSFPSILHKSHYV